MSEQEIPTAVLEKAKKLMAKDAEKAEKRKENVAKYDHAIPETLTKDEAANKYKVQIECTECGNTDRWVFTSDLFQVRHCEDCAKAAKAERKKKQREELAAAKKLLAENPDILKQD